MVENKKDKFFIEVKSSFFGLEENRELRVGEIISTTDKKRALDILERNLGALSAYEPAPKKEKRRVVIYHKILAPIGGIETSLNYLAELFKEENLEFIIRFADRDQALRLAKYHKVTIDKGQDLGEADVLILSSFDAGLELRNRIKARKTYQICHADWKELKKFPTWHNFEWGIDKNVDKVVAVSQTAHDSLKTAFKKPIDSVIAENIPPKVSSSAPIFLTLSRLTEEKGGDRIVEMVRRFNAAGKDFLWIIAATNGNNDIEKKLAYDPNVVFISPSTRRVALLKSVSYLVQLSDNESYCYSLHEALSVGTPVIGTRISEFNKYIKPGENGYLVKLDLSDLNIEAIFNKIPKFEPLKEKLSPNWKKIIKGEL